MTLSAQRRSLLLAAMSASVAGRAFAAQRDDGFAAAMGEIESASGGRLGVAALDLGRKVQLSHRGNELTPRPTC